MKCADPVLCYTDAQGKKHFRHLSLASNIIKVAAQLVYNCGKCIICRKKRAYELACRCVLHASMYKENCFLTLTYDEKREGYHNNFQYSDIQKFKKRLRAHVWRKFRRRIEIFNVHEYGKNGKKHWHLLVFNWEPPDKVPHSGYGTTILYTSKELGRAWPFGFSTVGNVEEGSAMYAAQYMEKDFKNNNQTSIKKSHSKHAGLGKVYFEAHFAQVLRLGYVPVNGKKLPLPRYFEKIAHKQYCHFYEKSAFFDLPWRKALYRPLKAGKENQIMADLYAVYREEKKSKILELEKEWEEVILQHLDTKEEFEFVKTAENFLYDLKNKQREENF